MYLTDCPICGARPMIRKDVIDGEYYMGWSVCCPRYKENDGIHDRKMAMFNLNSKKQAIEAWRYMCNE